MATATERKTAEERREAILEAAMKEFAEHGYEGTSTDAIARTVGISQPYLFRLYGTKKQLFLASIDRCFSDMHELFRSVSEGLTGERALEAMGDAYGEVIRQDPSRLRGQMQAYVACEDADVSELVQRGFGRIVELVETKGVPQEKVTQFFAVGMLMNVIASMNLLDADEPWAKRLIGFCIEEA